MVSNLSDSANINPWLYWSLLPLHRLFMKLYFAEIKIKGLEHLPKHGSAVFAPKHYSRWDPLVIALINKDPLYFMTNANQFEGFQGWLIKRLGAFPVDLKQPKVSSFRCAIELLEAGKKLVMFPEGGIVRDQQLRPLKTGLARLVLQAEENTQRDLKIPIVPIALHYQPNAEQSANILINISPALYTDDYRQDNDKHTATLLTQSLETSLLKGLADIDASVAAV